MSKGRLTRQELGWLLTQEAQGAAERLRSGVQVLITNAPPPVAEPTDSGAPAVDATLDALDDAMRMLSSLHQRPVSVRGRRGRIDVAALLWEVLPDTRVSIEPGQGAEVFGDEAELRRMLAVLVGPGTRANSGVTVRRVEDDVRVEVVLGPDTPATSDTERAWLCRMAIRYGGRYELEGGLEVLTLPADRAAEREEREALRRELDEARRQGEAYARELAAIFGTEEGPTSSSYPALATPALDRVATIARVSGALAAELRRILAQTVWDLQSVRPVDDASAGAGRTDGGLESALRRLASAQDFIGELAAIGELDAAEPSAEIDLVEIVRGTVAKLESRAQRLGVSLSVVTVPDGSEVRAAVRAAPRSVRFVLRALIVHALSASPRGKQVVISVAVPVGQLENEYGPRVAIDDAGPSIPPSARKPLLSLELEPSTYGRPSSFPLHVAATIAASVGAMFALDDSPIGGLRSSLTFGR